MAGVTPSGWEGKTLQQIVDELAAAAASYFGDDFPTTPDSVFGQFAFIFGASVKDLWDLGQAISGAQNRDEAEGIWLDYLANIIGLSRLQASGSTGELLFTGDQGTTVNSSFPVKDNLNRTVLTEDILELNRSSCYQSTFSVALVQDSTDYTIVVEGDTFIYTSGVGDTPLQILTGLDIVLDSGTGFTSEVVDEAIVITLDSFNNTLTTTNSINLNLDSVGSLVSATAIETGALTFEADTLTELGTSNLGIQSVTNPRAFNLGRSQETDEELRLRMSQQEASTGTATKPAIEASLSEITGVTSVLVIENITMTTDVNGIPPKAFEVFITGGEEDDIADVIWETKPAAIETHGDIPKIVIDNNGDEQVVKFSRKTVKYAWVRVTYSINSEETFPANGEDLIRAAVVETGEGLGVGEDFEPTKFYGNIYKRVSGVYVDNIEIAVTNLPTDTPTYQTTRIPVSDTETLGFDASRVPVTT